MRWWPLLLGLGGVAPAAAQDTLPGLPTGSATGPMLEYYTVADVAAPALTLRSTGIAAGKSTSSFGVGAVFDPARWRAVALTADLGIAYNHPVPGAHLLVEVGATGIFGAGAVAGGYLGVGAVVRVADGLGLRVGVSRRWFPISGTPIGVTVLGIGLAVLPRTTGAAPPP